MRLIDADALTEMFQNTDADGMNLALDRYAIKCIDNAPTIDAVEVVRCKDCKHYDIEIPSRCIKDRCYCATVDSFMKTTDFCSYAERRSDD